MRILRIGATLNVIVLLSTANLLVGCSDSEPDGYVFQMNGAGMTLPAAGAEVGFLPGNSRAEFFYGPIKEAYVYATKDLGTDLIPVCEEAEYHLDALQQEFDSEMRELQATGNLPETPDACFNMCTQRQNLEEQRGQAREILTQTISRLNNEIAEARTAIESLQTSRSEKAGELGKRLSALETAREKELSQRSKILLDEQVAKIRFSLSEQGVRYAEGQRIAVTLINGSDFAIRSGRARAEGYFQGEKIIESEINLPRYSDPNYLEDQFGFSKGYLVPSGGRVILGGESIYDFPGLSVSTPSGQLMVAEKGWAPNRRGYLLPDEIRIKSFSPNLFVVPDETGTRNGSTITYNPKPVDFGALAASKGLPQDREIAQLRRQIDNQSYSEDEQIKRQESLIASLNRQKKQASDDFNNSPLAAQISQLTSRESSCRSARDSFASIQAYSSELDDIKTDLSSCGSENIVPDRVLTAVAVLNRTYGLSIETPDIDYRYESKAMALIMSKLAENLENTSLSRIDGGYSLAAGIDPKSTLALVNWRSGFGESFWFQPLDSLGDSKDLTYVTAENGSFEEYLESVVPLGLGVQSLDELSQLFTQSELAARSPYEMRVHFKELAALAAGNLEETEGLEFVTPEEVGIPETTPSSCEP